MKRELPIDEMMREALCVDTNLADEAQIAAEEASLPGLLRRMEQSASHFSASMEAYGRWIDLARSHVHPASK